MVVGTSFNMANNSWIPKSAVNDLHVAAQPLAIMKIPRSGNQICQISTIVWFDFGNLSGEGQFEGNLVFFLLANKLR
ncbi:hypothetical protein NEUTE1DRAFT_117169, partial [Neurospora tetrasperma FGSC 2508]